MTINHYAPEQTSEPAYTEAQLAGRACRRCGSEVAPLHPDGTVETRVAVGVVRDNPVVVCTDDLVKRGRL